MEKMEKIKTNFNDLKKGLEAKKDEYFNLCYETCRVIDELIHQNKGIFFPNLDDLILDHKFRITKVDSVQFNVRNMHYDLLFYLFQYQKDKRCCYYYDSYTYELLNNVFSDNKKKYYCNLIKELEKNEFYIYKNLDHIDCIKCKYKDKWYVIQVFLSENIDIYEDEVLFSDKKYVFSIWKNDNEVFPIIKEIMLCHLESEEFSDHIKAFG